MGLRSAISRLVERRPRPAAPAVHHAARYDRQPWAVYAVGDIHGCLELYRQLETMIAEDMPSGSAALVVLLGDLVDRGASTAQLLDHLLAAPPTGMHRTAILGNHELMMLDFLRRPDPASEWLQHGGLETLLSYGLRRDDLLGASRRRLELLVESYIPREHVELLESLPLYVETPNTLLVHAGVREGVPVHEQGAETMTGYRDKFAATYDDLGKVVVHGHVIRSEPFVAPHRIAIDTGAYATGRLTAVRLRDGEGPAFFSTVNSILPAGVN